MNDIYNLFIESLKLRKAIEKCDKNQIPNSFESFPKDCCRDAHLILSKYLIEKGLGEFDLILGMRWKKSHAWLLQNKIILDITADQFDDQKEKVIVTTNSKWHDAFNGTVLQIADLNLLEDDKKNILLGSYKTIMNYLK